MLKDIRRHLAAQRISWHDFGAANSPERNAYASKYNNILSNYVFPCDCFICEALVGSRQQTNSTQTTAKWHGRIETQLYRESFEKQKKCDCKQLFEFSFFWFKCNREIFFIPFKEWLTPPPNCFSVESWLYGVPDCLDLDSMWIPNCVCVCYVNSFFLFSVTYWRHRRRHAVLIPFKSRASLYNTVHVLYILNVTVSTDLDNIDPKAQINSYHTIIMWSINTPHFLCVSVFSWLLWTFG